MSRFGRRAGIRVALAAFVAVAAVVGLWWKPWQSVNLPQSACWGILSKDDLKPLAGADGTAVARISASTVVSTLKSGPDQGVLPNAQCAVWWNQNRTLLSINVDPQSAAGMQAEEDPRSLTQAPVNLGSGVVLLWQQDAVFVYFRCEGITWTGSPYAEVQVDGGPFAPYRQAEGHASKSEMNAYANIALKVSRAVAKQVPCTNTLTFPQSAPTPKPAPSGS